MLKQNLIYTELCFDGLYAFYQVDKSEKDYPYNMLHDEHELCNSWRLLSHDEVRQMREMCEISDEQYIEYLEWLELEEQISYSSTQTRRTA